MYDTEFIMENYRSILQEILCICIDRHRRLTHIDNSNVFLDKYIDFFCVGITEASDVHLRLCIGKEFFFRKLSKKMKKVEILVFFVYQRYNTNKCSIGLLYIWRHS